jgi:uncharacterized membrane protein YkoI
MRPIPLAVAAAVLALVAAVPGPDAAEHDRARRAVEAGDALPLGDVLEAIQARHPGRALDAELVEQDGHPIYLVKWLGDDGTVLEVRADARTGELLDVR